MPHPLLARRILYGRAATAAAFSPLDLEPTLWLRADQGLYQERTGASATTPATSDGDPVGTWQDQSGNARHLTAASDGVRPTLKLAIQNGLPVVRFDGTDDYLGLDAAALGKPTDFTVVTVLAKANVTARGWALGSINAAGGSASAWGLLDLRQAGDGDVGYQFGDGTNFSLGRTATGQITNATFAVLVQRYTAGQTAAIIRVNGAVKSTTAGSSAASSSAGTAASFSVGRAGAFNGFYSGQDVGELLVFQSSLSDTNIGLLEVYLNNQWGVF